MTQSQNIENAGSIELIFLGTGTSSSLPHVDCLTQPPDGRRCKTCLSTLTPEGKKNIRRNTSAVVRVNGKDGRKATIVIDAGKNFQAAAVEWFPKYGLRQIDALLITHAHADAMNGLDDLRGWTLGNHIQSHIDVYVSDATFREVQRSFPYLVSKEFASGGGDVPEFVWHILKDKEAIEITNTGIQVTPFSVHHGRVFSTAPLPGYIPTPQSTGATTTPSESSVDVSLEKLTLSLPESAKKKEVIQPYLCFGFKIGHEIIYLSDVSHVPEDAWTIIQDRPGNDPLPICVLDCLHLRRHTSHLGLEQSIALSRKIGAQRTYFTGFSHEVSHDEYVTITEVVGGAAVKDEASLTKAEKRGLEMVGEGNALWVRPAHDGLRVFLEKGTVWDETY